MKTKILALVLAAFIAAGSSPLYASETAVDGKSIEFQLVGSEPSDSSKDVSLDVTITLLFNKNVVNFSVKDNNLNCIFLKDSSGQIVDANLIFPDDQVEPDKKREIYIDPISDLKENTTYTVEISADMLAKNGSTLGEPSSVSFTTLGIPVSNVPEQNDTQAMQTVSENAANDVNEEANNEAEPEDSSSETENPSAEIVPDVSGNAAEPVSDDNDDEKQSMEISDNESSEDTSDTSTVPVSANEPHSKSSIKSVTMAAALALAAAAIVILIKKKKRNEK